MAFYLFFIKSKISNL